MVPLLQSETQIARVQAYEQRKEEKAERLELAAEIAEAEAQQASMKAINAAHKAFLKNPDSLDSANLTEGEKARIRTYKPMYSWEPHPVAPYQFTNLSANIRRMKQRLERVAVAQATPETHIEGSNARLEDCPADNRVRLFFPGKPDEATRSRLKSNGFRWSPTIGAWQAYRNNRSIYTAKQEAGLTQPVAA